MPGVITGAALQGFYGKLPARGDFVRIGLPRDFVDPFDAWLAAAIAGSQDAIGEGWLAAYLEAPIWRFVLPPGLCGPRAVLGLMMPSVDSAGRYFPLTFALLPSDSGFDPDGAAEWLDQCETLGLAALERDLPPEAIRAELADAGPLPAGAEITASIWWTDGSVRIPPCREVHGGMPDLPSFMTMFGMAAAAASSGA